MYHNSSHIPTLMHAQTSTHAILTTFNRLETPCRGPGAYGINVWEQRPSARHDNRANNQKKAYLQAKNLQRHLRNAHGEYCTDNVTCLQNLYTCTGPGATACTLSFLSSSHIVNPSNTYAYTFLYICHSLNIQQAQNTLCRGPGACSVNVWGQRPTVRQNNRGSNEKKVCYNRAYLQAKNLRH